MSSQQFEKMLIPTGIIHQFNIVATQPVGAPTPMGFAIAIPAGERGLFLGGVIGPDNYGAGRSLTIKIRPDGSSQPYVTIGADTVDNERILLGSIQVSSTTAATAVDSVGLSYMPFILPEFTEIIILGTSLANTETITGMLLIATRILPPTVAAIGAGVTLTTNTRKGV